MGPDPDRANFMSPIVRDLAVLCASLGPQGWEPRSGRLVFGSKIAVPSSSQCARIYDDLVPVVIIQSGFEVEMIHAELLGPGSEKTVVPRLMSRIAFFVAAE